MYEVCIIGGGIAGSTLSYNLAPELEVCIVEKKPREELGNDPCGNAVHKNWFDSKKIKPKPSDFDAVDSEVERIDVNLDGDRMKRELDGGNLGLVLDKAKYVRDSLEASQDRGADYISGRAKPVVGNGRVEKVKVNSNDVKAEIYVDASGVPAVLRSNFLDSPDGALFKGYREIVAAELSEKSWQVFQDDPDSAFWAFPQGDRTNIGRAVFRNDVNLKKGVERMKERLGIYEADVKESGYGSIPSYKPIPLVYGNTVAIGDAGFTVNPVTGGGIGPTVTASNLLAESLTNGKLSDFEEKYFDQVAGNYERNYWLSRFYLKLQPFIWKRVGKWAFKEIYGGDEIER